MSLSSPQHSIATSILSTLPPTTYAFAYGSGIIPQANVSASSRMLDIILVVDNPQQWHSLNLIHNPSHYSEPMRLLGASAIANLQQSTFGAQVYYNTILPPTNTHAFKYGVITRADLVHDLTTWDSLYLSGRMHKPIHDLTPPPHQISNAMASNRSAAAAAALLSLPSRFRELDLYMSIASLSYTGDIRMKVPVEVASKVADIVRANVDHFRTLYKPCLKELNVFDGRDGIWNRRMEVKEQLRLLDRLPVSVVDKMKQRLGITSGGMEAVARCERAKVGRAVVATVATIVSRSSLRQSVKGIATAGLINSAKYLASKMTKRLKSRWIVHNVRRILDTRKA